MKDKDKLRLHNKCSLRLPNGKLSLTGLTFIELLLATVMLSVLSAALYGMLSNGITIWQKVNQETPQIDINLFAQKIELDLRNCVYFKKIPFSGQTDMISFPALVTAPVSENGFTKGVGRVSYLFNAQEKTINRKYIDYRFFDSLKSQSPRIIVNNIKKLSFAYYYFSQERQQFFWAASWPPADSKERISAYPQAIRLTMVIDMGSRIQTRTKTVNIPIGGLLR